MSSGRGRPKPRRRRACGPSSRLTTSCSPRSSRTSPVQTGRWEGRGALWTINGAGRFIPYTVPWNFTGQPAAAVPAGLSAAGLPLAVQLVGRPDDEDTILSLAAQLEARAAMGRPPPARLVDGASLDRARTPPRAAGAVLLERFGGPRREVRSKSTPTDLVSEADLEAERALRALLAARRPDDAVLGEEGGDRGAGTSGVRWIVDPLDGTVNFLFGIPQWAVSVACADGDGLVAGVVLDPLRDEIFAATRDGPATRDGEPVERVEPRRAGDRDGGRPGSPTTPR